MKKTIVILLLLIQLPVVGRSLTLKQCLSYALDNNSTIKCSVYDKAIAQKKIDEQIGTIYPQISISSALNDDYKKTTQISSIAPGTKYSSSASAQLQQKIYDPTFFVALKAAKISSTQSELNATQTKEKTVYSVCRGYYQIVIIQKQYNVLNKILQVTKETLKATELKFNNGLAKKIDVDKNRVSYNNMLSQVQQAELNYKQAVNNLKYTIGIPVDSLLTLSDTALTIPDSITPDTTIGKYWENRTDYKLLKTNLSLLKENKNQYIASYLPSVSLNASYSYQSSSDELSFYDAWYTNSGIGLSVSIPVFDGFQKRARLAQANYSIRKSLENIAATEQSIKVDVSNYEMQYRIALDNLSNQEANLELAEDVYKNTQLSYQQGAESTLGLIQAESSMQEAQNNYFNTLLSLYYARIDLEQSKGNLLNYVEQFNN